MPVYHERERKDRDEKTSDQCSMRDDALLVFAWVFSPKIVLKVRGRRGLLRA